MTDAEDDATKKKRQAFAAKWVAALGRNWWRITMSSEEEHVCLVLCGG